MSNDIAPAEAPVVSTEMAVSSIAALQSSKYADEDFGGISGSRISFLPRLQLFTSNSEQVKEGKIGVAHYGLISQNETKDLGKEVLGIPLAWRAKAMFLKSDPVLAYHNPKSPEFQDIRKKADADSNSGNMYGPEFLVWLGPDLGFATFFMGSKTARNSAPSVKALLPANGALRVGVFSAEFIKTDSYSWHGPKIVVSAQSIAQPDGPTLEAVITDFLNPKDSVVQATEAAPADATTTDR